MNRIAKRAWLYIPCSDPKKIIKASSISNVDAIIFDLEDSVPLNAKANARSLLLNAKLSSSQYTTVRMNSVGSSFEHDDLEVILRKSGVHGIVIPKVSTANDLDVVLSRIKDMKFDLYPCIESAKGLLNIKDIIQYDSRVNGVFFAAEDYCADAGLLRTASRRELLYPRQKVSSVAAAYGIESIDLVCIDYKSSKVLEEECKEGKEWGFTGKQAIHPTQVEIIQREFAPSRMQIDKALAIIKGYEESVKKGMGAFNLDGIMVDMPVVKWAQKTLERAQQFKSSKS